MKFIEHIGLNTCLGRNFHGDYYFLIKNNLKIIKIRQILIKLCVKSYKIPLGLRNHVQNSSFRVLTCAKDAQTYITDEFRDENK